MTDSEALVQPTERPSLTLALVGSPGLRLWGLTGAERWRRLAARQGVEAGGPPTGGAVLAARCDAVVGEAALAALLRRRDAVLLDEDGAGAVASVAPAGAGPARAAFLADGRWLPDLSALPAPALRPESAAPSAVPGDRPLARLVDAESRKRAEWRLYDAAPDAPGDALSAYLWRYPAFYLAQLAALLRLGGGALTLMSALLAVVAALLLARGDFIAGLACAWASMPATVAGGRLARIALSAGRRRAALERALAIARPVLWGGGWLLGLDAVGALGGSWPWIAPLLLAGPALQRMLEAGFAARRGFPLSAWRPFDSWFALARAGGNSDLILLTAFTVAGKPYLAVISVALWTGATLALHMTRIAQAARVRTLRPWRTRAGLNDEAAGTTTAR